MSLNKVYIIKKSSVNMKKAGFVILFLMFMLPLASAEIFISQPKSVYNVGDAFSFNVTLMPGVATNNFFTAKLVCVEESQSGEVEIYRSPQSVALGAQKSLDVSGKFDNFLIGTLGGDCHLRTEYADSGANSKNFEVSRAINVNVATDKVIVDPGERFNVSGKAIKANGNLVEKGFVELRLSELNITSFRAFEGGKFSFLFDIAEDTPSGDYQMVARVYEKNEQGEITNEGSGETGMRINQIIKKGVIAVGSQKAVPGNDFVYTVLLYDQANREAVETVEVAVYKPDGELLEKRLVKSGESNNVTIGSSFAPGQWSIESKIKDITAQRTFDVEELESLDYELVNQTLVVRNTGNVPYQKTVEIMIGAEKVVEEIYAGVGETRRYALSAPDGEYPIGVNDGENKEMVGTALLTGNAVGVEREGDFNFWRTSYVLIWLMIISLGVLVAFYQYDKISKKSYIGKTPQYEAPITISSLVPVAKNNIITDGKREECAIIALKIKNLEEIERAKGSALEAVERALRRARDGKAKVYADKNYKTMIFSPSLTNEKDNSLKAVSIAREIETMLLEHNKRFGEKIMFGIGVHNGEMIIENAGGEFKFSPIGNTMPFAKKVADTVSSSTGVSEFVHRRILGKVKSDKIEGTNYWRIGKVRESGLHSEFINKFVEKQKREGMFKR
jgi:hypothetical protein